MRSMSTRFISYVTYVHPLDHILTRRILQIHYMRCICLQEFSLMWCMYVYVNSATWDIFLLNCSLFFWTSVQFLVKFSKKSYELNINFHYIFTYRFFLNEIQDGRISMQALCNLNARKLIQDRNRINLPQSMPTVKANVLQNL